MLTPVELKTLETYERIAPEFARRHTNPEFWGKEFRYFKELLPKGMVIDLGCGPARDATLFIESGYSYIGVDASAAQLEQAKMRAPNAHFLKAELKELCIKDKCAQGFWASASLLHIPKKSVGAALREIKRVTKNNGIGFISVKQGYGEKFEHSSIEGDERFFAYWQDIEFQEVLNENGFGVLRHNTVESTGTVSKKITIWLVYFVRVL